MGKSRKKSKQQPRGSSNTSLVVQDLARDSSSRIEMNRSSRKRSRFESSRMGNQTKIFASMCPDEILDHYDDYDTRSYKTTLMLGDVSGFTDMTEKLTKSDKGGPSKLTDTLNSYIGPMVQEILSHGGDVLKFSGDAFIVMWKLEAGGVMRDIATEAIKTACVIQKHFGTYETEIDVELKVKLAIASGKTYFTSIGNPDLMSYYIITGKPVWEVKFAEGLCQGGDILVAPSCWQHVNQSEYIHELLPDHIHTRIISLSVLWENINKHTYEHHRSADTSSSSNSSDGSNESSVFSNLSEDNISSSSTSLLHSSLYQSYSNEEAIDYSLRPKLIRAARAKLGKKLRSYVLRPVIRSVEMDEPLEYLTEIRQVVIVFVNVITEEINRKTLIKLVDATFSFVCGIVGEMQGCVNKTSLFDKDLIFLCIFGLRGDKHELESQIGLRCALKLRRGLAKYQYVQSVTVGVTTGMTYCGVVGHVLRREYTVIGMAVNKAARLMCAYSNKVVCDRESFLLSHLEAKHFVLQEPKELKGITNVGPIYEFFEQTGAVDNDVHISKYPLLDRDAQLETFHEMMEKVVDSHAHADEEEIRGDVLILRGDPRMGKTRLLEEMSHLTPAHVMVNFIALAPYDNQLSFILLRLIFDGLLDIRDASAHEERQNQIYSRFPDTDRSHLCALNRAFNVTFRETDEFLAYEPRKRNDLLKKLLKTLTRRCFEAAWLVMVDDAELADEESLALLPTVVKHSGALFVLAYGNKLSRSYALPEKIVDMARVVDIQGIDKWYHAALACQILNVVAIPVELEKVIQERSWGNPGWIESYLVSLIQLQGVAIESLTRRELEDAGLVEPSSKMLKRPSGQPIFKARSFDAIDRDMWKMYKSTYRVSDFDKSRDASRKKRDNEAKYSVCVLTSRFAVEDVDSETTMDTILIKLYDSLTPLDQFLLKCAAVLGEIVDRKMLERLMQGTPERDVALSIVKLFELRIIGCTVGDFTRSPGPAMLFKKLHNPSLQVQVRCGCKGVVVRPALADLPNYAACGMMRFKLDMFRETTYRLLTENQKVEFHSKALRYLQQNTRRCASCGGGQFNKLLGKTVLVETARKRSQITDPMLLELKDSSTDLANFSDDVTQWNDDNAGRTKEKNSLAENHKYGDGLSWFRACRPIEKSPTRVFSQVDFTNCQCNLILLTVYTHVMEHCRGIGIKPLLLVAILEFVEVCISTLNIPQATKLLHEADKLIDLVYDSSEDGLVVLPCLKGKVQTFRGQCFLESGLTAEAMLCFEATLKIMGYAFPKNRVSIGLKSAYLLQQQFLMLNCLRRFKVGSLRDDGARYNDQFASCLAQMFIVYRMKGMHDHAKLAAIWGLNVALESSKDFFVLCTSYAHMMITAQANQYNAIIPLLETEAINLCNQRDDSIELQELNAVAKLYMGIFRSRWVRGLRQSAASIGYVAERLATTTRLVDLKLIILPRLVQLIQSQGKFAESVDMLLELEYVSQNNIDLSGITWYYSLCVDLLLEIGVSVLPLHKCEEFYQEESSKITNAKDFEAAKRFFVCMWLWYIRIGDWESAFVWKDRECDLNVFNDYTVTGAITTLKKLEGLIINYVARMNNKNLKDAAVVLKRIKEELRIIKDTRKVVKIVESRYFLLKAYYNMARCRRKKGLAILRGAKKYAFDRGNQLIYLWADHCEKAWTGSLNPIQENCWKDECMRNKPVVDWQEIDLENREILHYTLPIPREC
ncbi:adenylate cyclase type 10-like [Copidosoma floridanum]|uniref:adenylate cyclase type 10-like n=1 Tax=Copidosoma floridanum TaxID=29053 RepID=UPI0006C9B4DE|nr:adenylate cyclase type 10-like [Copidosoma floridanum]